MIILSNQALKNDRVQVLEVPLKPSDALKQITHYSQI